MQGSDAEERRRKRFDQKVGVFHQDMYRYAAWLCRDKAIAEDVVQEALLRAWKSLDALRDDAAAKPWPPCALRGRRCPVPPGANGIRPLPAARACPGRPCLPLISDIAANWNAEFASSARLDLAMDANGAVTAPGTGPW